MNCPKCKKEMATKKVSGVEVDICVVCEGVFLEKGELSEVNRKNLAFIFDRVSNLPKAGLKDDIPAQCPLCNHAMTPLKSDEGFNFDWCETCEGMFFDQGELATLGLSSE